MDSKYGKPLSTSVPTTAGKKRPRYRAVVKRVLRLSPRMLSITFCGEDLLRFEWNGPASHIKLIFDGGSHDANNRPVMRTYTPRRYDITTGELDVEFVLHGNGPAADWARDAAPGMALTISGPGRGYIVDTAADWYLLAGDETAIPAIATILEVLHLRKPVYVFLEVADPAERRVVGGVAPELIFWLYSAEDSRQSGQLLQEALQSMPLPSGSGCVYVGCESGAARAIRRLLLIERGLSATRVTTRGYWKLGAANPSDQDFGDDT